MGSLERQVAFFVFRVGLSAGTGLGVSSALVQNNDQVNADAANNNPVPGANQGAANNQPVAAVNANDDDDDFDDDIIEDDDVIDDPYPGNGHAPVYGPVNQPNNVGDDMEVDAIENDALNDDHDKPNTMQKHKVHKEQNNKNVGNSSGEENEDGKDEPCCSCHCHKSDKSDKSPKAKNSGIKAGSSKDRDSRDPDGPSGSSESGHSSGMQLRPRSSAGIVTPKKDDKSKDWEAGKAGNCDEQPGSSQECKPLSGKQTPCKSGCSTPGAKNKRKSCHTSDGGNTPKVQFSGECSSKDKGDVAYNSKDGAGSSSGGPSSGTRARSESPDQKSNAEKEGFAASLELETRPRRSARLSRSHAVNEDAPVGGQSSVTPPPPIPPVQPPPSTSVTPSSADSADPDASSPEPGQRKGKSWYVLTSLFHNGYIVFYNGVMHLIQVDFIHKCLHLQS